MYPQPLVHHDKVTLNTEYQPYAAHVIMQFAMQHCRTQTIYSALFAKVCVCECVCETVKVREYRCIE